MVVEQPLGLFDREQRAIGREMSLDRHAGKHFCYERGVVAAHDGIGIGNDEGLKALELRLDAATHRLRAVTRIYVSPEVPLALARVGIEGRKRLVVLHVHDVGKAQPHHLEAGVPAAELRRHGLVEQLAERVRRFRPREILFIYRHIRRRIVKGQAQHGFA